MLKIFLTILLTVIAAFSYAQTHSFGTNLSNTDATITSATHQFIESLVKQDKFSGVVVIIKNDAIIYRGAFGEACKEFNVPNTFSTAFNLASMTKMFTGIAITQLVEQG